MKNDDSRILGGLGRGATPGRSANCRLEIASNSNCPNEIRVPLVLAGPDQRFEPADCRGIIEVERTEIESGTPGNPRQFGRDRRCRIGQTSKLRRIGCRVCRGDPPIAEGVCISVRKKAKPGGGSDFD